MVHLSLFRENRSVRSQPTSKITQDRMLTSRQEIEKPKTNIQVYRSAQTDTSRRQEYQSYEQL